MSRVRLTHRRQGADARIPYPGNVNQPDRRDPDWEQYHTFEQTVNHELPDMRHEWKDDSRDDIGFGIPEANPPTVASVRVAANKAVRIAVLLLGEKVDDDVIEAQARDLMSLSQEAMDRTLDRFSKSQSLYADDEEEDKKEEEKKASKELADKASEVPPPVKAPEKAEEKKAEEKKAEEKVEEKKEDEKKEEKEEKKAEDKAEEKKEDEKKEAKSKKSEDEEEEKDKDEKKEAKSKKSEDKEEEKDKDEKKEAKSKKSEDKKEMPEFIKEKIEESKKDKKADEDDDEEEKDEDKSKKADEDDDEEEKDEDKKEAKVAGPNELNIELTSAADEEIEPDAEADAQLASLFDDGLTAKQEEQPKAASSKKAGIKKLGGQPKVAAEDAAPVDISSIWDSAPDVSQLFK